MNILLINHYAGSARHGMEYRPYYFARDWVKNGHTVTIVASSESHVRSVKPDVIGPVTEEWIEGIRYIWLKTPPYEGNGVKRAINMFSFVISLFKNMKSIFNGNNPEVVIASSTYPLDIYPAYFFSKKTGAKLIFEVHDLWPLSPIELGGMSPWHPFIFTLQLAENFAYKHADKVVSLLPMAKNHMIEHGMKPEKFVYIPNGVDIDEWNNSEDILGTEHHELIAKLKEQGKFIVGYAGAHGLANALHSLVEAAECIKNLPVAYIFIGQGPEKNNLIEKAKELELNQVYFLPPVPKKLVPRLLSEMDTLYIGLKSEPLFRFGISPNKLMDYMMAAKPVIQAIDAGNDLVRESGCGISVSPENAEEIANAIKTLLQMSDGDRKQLGINGKQFVLKQHNYQILAEKFIEEINNL